MAGGAHSREPRPFGWDIVKQHPGMASWQTATRWRKYLDRDKITFFYDRHTMMCRWFLALAVLLVATDFGKHLLILIQDHLVWLLQGASRVVFLLSLSGNSSLLDAPLLCLILQPDLMIQWLSLFVTLWYFTTQSSGIIHYTRTLQVIRNFSSPKG